MVESARNTTPERGITPLDCLRVLSSRPPDFRDFHQKEQTMTTQISTFNFKSNPVRIETVQNEPYFCLTDVCSALAINNANSSRFRFNKDGIHKMYSVDKLDRKNELTFINEPNLYRIIFSSNKAEAVEFQN